MLGDNLCMLAPIPPPPPSQRSVIIKKPRSLARRLMQEAGSVPLPVFALRIQDRARATANDFLREHGYREHRLYVLEIAGHTPRIKIGYSSAPWERLARHIGEVKSLATHADPGPFLRRSARQGHDQERRAAGARLHEQVL